MPSLASDLAGSTQGLPHRLLLSTPIRSQPKLNNLIMLRTIPKMTPRRPHPLGNLQKSHQRYIPFNSSLTKSNYWHCISSPTLKLSSGPSVSQQPPLEKLAPPSAILICQREPSNTGKSSTFQCGTSISGLSKIHGR